VTVVDMPIFLDSFCIKFLLEYGKTDIKRHELHKMLKELRLQAKKERITSVFKLKMSNSQ
jgi:hypothetical protein